jgi:hypothetical protein
MAGSITSAVGEHYVVTDFKILVALSGGNVIGLLQIPVLAIMHGFGFVKLAPKAALYAADIIGGLILGAGIALAGACPGTVMAQVGAGYRDAIFTLVGGLGGAVAYSYAETTLSKTFLASGAGKLVLSDVLGIPYWTGALALAVICVAILLLLERSFPSGGELGSDVDGDLPPAGYGKRRHGLMPAE